MFLGQVSEQGLRSPGGRSLEQQGGLPLYEGIFQERSRGPERQFKIQLAVTDSQRTSATNLINRMYAFRGYGSEHYLNGKAHCATFAASIEGETVGTLSLTVDSEFGLSADDTFEDLLSEARKNSQARICELTKFAFSPSSTSMHVLASLFHTIFIFGTGKYRCTDLFIEVNPRHIRFYEVMLGFVRAGKLRINRTVNAPSQLMRLKVADIGRFIQMYSGGDGRSTRSLYPYFLTAAQECLIQERMTQIDAHWPFSKGD